MTRRPLFLFALFAALLATHAAAADDWRWRRGPRWGRDEIIIGIAPWPSRQLLYAPPPVYIAPTVVVPPPPVIVMPDPVLLAPRSDVYVDAWGRYCREYHTTVIIAGTVQEGFGTACQMPNGQWQIVR